MTGQQTGRPAGKHNCQNPADGFLKNEIAKAKKVTIVKIPPSKTLHWQLQAKAQKQPITKAQKQPITKAQKQPIAITSKGAEAAYNKAAEILTMNRSRGPRSFVLCTLGMSQGQVLPATTYTLATQHDKRNCSL
jgi:hypothetical protein